MAISLCFASCSDNKQGEAITAGDVPPAVMTAFSTKYPGAADAKWEKETHAEEVEYEVEFMHDGKKKHAEYEADGGVVEED
ncbi:MAG: putative beta-lactamase-inhibitor-like, PepSY-like [Flavipsychrobacter sp.]|nr:putative beta-lactamase-inhibitor-like, PepSY-like [Flavipsychrobacter sp.]